MTFAILGGIGAAIADAAVVVGNVGGALAASVLPAAIGGGAAGAGTLGTMAGATLAGTAGSALAGTSMAPAIAAGAGTAAGSAIPAGISSGAAPSVAGMFPATTSVGGSAVPTATQTMGALASNAGLAAPGGSGAGGLGSLLTTAGKAIGPMQMAMQGYQGIQNQNISDQNQKAGAAQQAQDQAKSNQQFQNSQTLARGLYGKAGGGEEELHDGSWIIPADVVSALGDGSTDAGARFLDEFFGKANPHAHG